MFSRSSRISVESWTIETGLICASAKFPVQLRGLIDLDVFFPRLRHSNTNWIFDGFRPLKRMEHIAKMCLVRKHGIKCKSLISESLLNENIQLESYICFSLPRLSVDRTHVYLCPFRSILELSTSPFGNLDLKYSVPLCTPQCQRSST